MNVSHASKMAVLAGTFAFAAGTASAQVVVAAGQTLTRADLLAGQFNGVPFTLGPDLVIDIHDGGAMGNLSNPDFPLQFDLAGATINVHAGGTIQSGPEHGGYNFVSNLNLNIFDASTVGPQFAAYTSAGPANITMHAGSFGNDLFLSGGQHPGSFIMLGGSIGDDATLSSMPFTLIDGSVGHGFNKAGFAPFHMAGGAIGDDFRVNGPASITGGTVGDALHVAGIEAMWGGSGFLTISGGTFGNEMYVGGYIGDEGELAAGHLTLNVRNLMIDGEPLQLTLGEPLLVTQRAGAVLEATLADGSYFDLLLNDIPIAGQDYVSQHAVLTVNLVPSPGASGLVGMLCFIAIRRRRSCVKGQMNAPKSVS